MSRSSLIDSPPNKYPEWCLVYVQVAWKSASKRFLGRAFISFSGSSKFAEQEAGAVAPAAGERPPGKPPGFIRKALSTLGVGPNGSGSPTITPQDAGVGAEMPSLPTVGEEDEGYLHQVNQ